MRDHGGAGLRDRRPPAVVADFDGYQISDIGSGDDDELLEVLRLIEDHASKPVDDLAP